jgi:hypothetical protein
MEWGIDISIGEDKQPRRKLILEILKHFEANNEFLINIEEEASKKLGLVKPRWKDEHAPSRYKFATYSKFMVADLEYRLAISTYVVYKLLQE